jgi:hypothetical protein
LKKKKKEIQNKRAGNVTQVVKCLPTMYKAMNLILSTPPKKIRKRKKEPLIVFFEKQIYWQQILSIFVCPKKPLFLL